MKKTSFSLNYWITLTLSILVFTMGEYLFFTNQSLLYNVLDKAVGIYTFSGLIITVFWNGYSRLNSLDDLDNLKDFHRDLVRKKVNDIKDRLHQRIAILILLCLALFAASSSRVYYHSLDIFLAALMPVMFSVICFYSATYPNLFNAIDSLRSKVSDMRRKEKARQQLIAELKKERKEQPLIADEHLKKYKTIFK